MKKYTLFIVVLIFVFGLFNINLVSANVNTELQDCSIKLMYSEARGIETVCFGDITSGGAGTYTITQTLTSGSIGTEVIGLQKILNSLGYNVGNADGKFGAKTKAAVMAFQASKGLTADGVFGAKSRASFVAKGSISGNFPPGCESASGYSLITNLLCDPISGDNIIITTPSALPNAKVGIPYSATFKAAGGSNPFAWRVISVVPPSTVFSNVTWGNNCSTYICGPLGGIPTKAGTYRFKVTVTSGRQTASKDFTLTIDPATSSDPTIISILPAGCTTNTGSSPTGVPCSSNRTSANFGDTVYLYGTNFYPNSNGVLEIKKGYGNYPKALTSFVSSSLISFVVPSEPGNGIHEMYYHQEAVGADGDSNVVSLNFTGTPTVPIIQLLSPNGGETFNLGQQIIVKWSSTMLSPTDNIQISLHQSAFPFSFYILSDGTLNDGLETVSVPSNMSVGQYVLHITKIASGVYDYSYGLLNIISGTTQPTITVLSPNGGETFSAGQSITVRWSSANIPATANILVEIISIDKPVSSDRRFYLKSIVNANTGTYTTTIPTNSPSYNYKVHVGYGGEKFDEAEDNSNAPFRINNTNSCFSSSPSLKLWIDPASPSSNIQLGSTNVELARYDLAASGNCDLSINLLTFGGSSDSPIENIKLYNENGVLLASCTSTLNGCFTLTPPLILNKNQTKKVIIKADIKTSSTNTMFQPMLVVGGWLGASGSKEVGSNIELNGYNIFQETNNQGPVRLFVSGTTSPTVVVISPNGGESLALGSQANIRWSVANPGTMVGVFLYNTAHPSNYKWKILDGLTSSSAQNSNTWTVGQGQPLGGETGTPGAGTYRIQVCKNAGGTYSDCDYSDATFSITSSTTQPTITVTSPNGGETWAVGSTHTITWSSKNFTGIVDIRYAEGSTGTGNGPNWIALGIPNSGSYEWTIPSNLSGQYRITVQANVGGGVGDYSDAPFTITSVAPPALTNNAQFISQVVPTSMVKGQTYPVSVTMKNTGTTTWTSADQYKLGSQNPQDNATWGGGRVYLSAGESIAPGANKTFSFNVIAPTTLGLYNFQWKMVRENVAWFGDITTNVRVSVLSLGTGGGIVKGAESFVFTQRLALGSFGNEVTELQKFLNTSGYDVGVADGKFGLKTETAVINFQIANSLNGDGIVGTATRALLNK